MEQLPHQYSVELTALQAGSLTLSSGTLPHFEVSPPVQFDGPGDNWSPEELLMSSLASCLVLSFRAIATASKLQWSSIKCKSTGELAKTGKSVQFSTICTNVSLEIAKAEDESKALRLLNKAEQTCFISNSLNSECSIICEITVAS